MKKQFTELDKHNLETSSPANSLQTLVHLTKTLQCTGYLNTISALTQRLFRLAFPQSHGRLFAG